MVKIINDMSNDQEFMEVGMVGQQQEEIETISSRTIEVKLSDADVKRISEKAAAYGWTVGELIENFN